MTPDKEGNDPDAVPAPSPDRTHCIVQGRAMEHGEHMCRREPLTCDVCQAWQLTRVRGALPSDHTDG